ncbi:hypothetical protein GJ496_011816, partial [Pomphorhynchus laevis]
MNESATLLNMRLFVAIGKVFVDKFLNNSGASKRTAIFDHELDFVMNESATLLNMRLFVAIGKVFVDKFLNNS